MRGIAGAACVLIALAAPLLAADPQDYIAAAALVRQGNWPAALSATQALVARYPDNPKVLNLRGLALTGSGKTGQAIAAFEAALKIAPQFTPALKNLTIVEWNAKRQPAARRHLAVALKTTPDDPVLNAYAALAAVEDKQYETARRHLAAAGPALASLPAEVEFRIGAGLAALEKYADAAVRFRSLLERYPDSYNIAYNLGLCEFLAGDRDTAATTLERLLAKKPAAEIENLLAQVYEAQGRTQLAVDALRRAISMEPRDETNYLDLAALCTDHNSYPLGIEIIEAGLAVMPGSPRLVLEHGLLQALTGHYAEAEEDFDRAGRLSPENDLVYAGLGLAAIQRGRLDDAIVLLRERVRTDPNSAPLWYLLGSALIRNGAQEGSPEFREAQETFSRAIRLGTKLPYPYIELAKIYLRTDQTDAALPLLDQAVKLGPNERSAWSQLAIAYRRKGEMDKVRAALNRVLALNQEDRTTKLHGVYLVKRETGETPPQ